MNFIGSKTIKIDRLVLKSSQMKEQKRLYEILMIPEVNKWYLTSGKNIQMKKNIGHGKIKKGFMNQK